MNGRDLGTVSAVLPLSLLEAVRAHDRPSEILEDEDLTISLPRRLGLTGVIDNQIRQYETAKRTGRSLSLEEVQSLFRLVLKRPDAEAIMREAGQRIAVQHFDRVPQGYVKVLRALPRGLMTGAYRRSARRLLKRITGSATIEISGRPPIVKLHNNALASLEPPGTACALYTAALAHLAELYMASAASASHSCSRGNAAPCEWKLTGF